MYTGRVELSHYVINFHAIRHMAGLPA